MNYDLILASQSPRRKQLLTEAGYTFIVDAPDDSVERGICSKCSPDQLVVESAFLKAAVRAGCSILNRSDDRYAGQSRRSISLPLVAG